MGTNISKQGIAYASGNIGDNLLCGSYYTLVQTANGSSNYNYTIPDISKIVSGVKLVISVDIELYNVASMSRIGAEPSFSTNSGTYYIGVWTTDVTNRKQRISAVRTMGDTATGVGQRGIYIQGVTFNSGGYIKISNPKLEIGTIPTPWTPNVNDDMYVSNTSGFFELVNPISSNTSIAKEYMLANQFYEL